MLELCSMKFCMPDTVSHVLVVVFGAGNSLIYGNLQKLTRQLL
jgi:hypothetical protein